MRRIAPGRGLLLSPGIALLFQIANAITAAAAPPNNSSISPIAYVRHLVGSTSPNDRYLLLCLLETGEPRLWAGTDPQIPAVLDAFEVELIMQQLDSPDGLIRAKVWNIIQVVSECLIQRPQTLKVLHKVEPEVVVAYFSRMLESASSAAVAEAKAEYSLRMLQVAEVLSGEDSESYAQYLVQVLGTIEGEDTGGKVIQEVVEYALTYIRTGTFPEMIEDTCLPVTLSFVLGRWWCHRTIDSFGRRKRSHGSYFPPDCCRVGVRV